MLHRAYALSSTTEAFNEDWAKLRSILSRLDYPLSLIDSVISNFDSRQLASIFMKRMLGGIV